MHYSFLPYCVHLTVLTTSRTHCHFVKQARALHVLEVCVHTCVPTHSAAWFCFSLWCLHVRLSIGPSELNRSYCTGNSLSALQSSQQFRDDTSPRLCIHWSPHRTLTSSGSALGPQLLHGHISSPVLAGPTCNVTGEAMPTSLAEVLTPLSFLEFLQRCNLLIAPLQPSQLPVTISPLDAAVQTSSPCDASQDASTQTSDQPVFSSSLDVAVQTSFHCVRTSPLDAAVQTIPHSTLSQNVSAQMGSRSASSFSVDVLVQTPIRSAVSHDVSTQLPITEFFVGCIFSNDPLDRHNFVRQSTRYTCFAAAAARTRTARPAS